MEDLILSGSRNRAISADQNLNVFSVGEEQREGSLVFSDIEFPSHVSELQSFQSQFDFSVCSNDCTSAESDPHEEQEIAEKPTEHKREKTLHQTSIVRSDASMLPDLPEQAEENVKVFLAALNAATLHGEKKESDEGSNGCSKSLCDTSKSSLDSSKFISKESFPESMLGESLQSWVRDTRDDQADDDSRLPERFLLPSKTPDKVNNIEAENNVKKDVENPFDDDGFSFNQEFQDGFSFQSAGDPAELLDKAEEEFKASHLFDKEDAMNEEDFTMFSEYVLPESSGSDRRSRAVIGVNDPDDKGEVRISFGNFFAARTEELGRLSSGNKDHPRIGTSANESPEAARPQPLISPSSRETAGSIAINPNDSTLAALKFCQSSEGSKILSMSSNELKLLSHTLARVTQGESAEIYKVLTDFINRRKSLSEVASDFKDESQNSSNVFSVKRRDISDPSIVEERPRSPEAIDDSFTFYHSDTNCEVSPTGSKFEPLPVSVPSPPLNTSSPKNTGTSIAVQTESHINGSQQAHNAGATRSLSENTSMVVTSSVQSLPVTCAINSFGGHTVPASKSAPPHPRYAFHSQSEWEANREVPGGVERAFSVNEQALLNRETFWNGKERKQIGQRQEPVWNSRTEHPSQIQMVIPPVLDFPGVLCIGLSSEALLPIHNPTSRWIRCTSVIVKCTLNGVQVDPQHDSPFLIRETTLIGPKLTENVKIEFTCAVAGIYVAEMKVISLPVGSIGSDNETSANIVTVQGFSEHPNLEVMAGEGQTLDFGEVHGGHNALQPFQIVNKGRTAIPLKMLICSTSSPGMFVFSKKNSPNEVKQLEINNTVLTCLLPASNGLVAASGLLTIWVELVGKNHHCFEKCDQPEIFTAVINIQLDTSNVARTLGSVSLKGVIGVTHIQIPKAFQMAMCLSSSVGQKVSRQLPFSNIGNICANVELTIPKYSNVFMITPDKFPVKPGMTVTVEVSFCPRMNSSYETVLQISESPKNKWYEILLRGSSVEPQPAIEDGIPTLLSNKSWLYWTGVDIGKAVHKRLFLLNDSPDQSIQFRASILGEHADFEIQRMKSDFTRGGNSSDQITLRPRERVPVYVLFAPSSLGVFKSALVLNQAGGPRFKVPLYAYAGTSNIYICETEVTRKTSDGYASSLGQVSLGHRNILKLTLINSGSRSAFVKAVCFADHQIRLHYPKTHLSIVPSEFILPERSSKELVIVFQPLHYDAKDCQSQVKRVATVMFHYGDEVLRQWYKRNLSKHHDLEGRGTTGNVKFENFGFEKSFQDENCVAEDLDFHDLDDYQEVFDSHVSQVLLNLLGGPEKQAGEPPTDDIAAVVMATPRAKTLRETRASIRCQTPAQKESATKENVLADNKDDNEAAGWSLIPEQLILKVPVKGSTDSSKKVQLLNYTDRSLEFEFSWPAHCIAVTPHVGTIPPKNQASIRIGVWSSISSSGVELPWRGTAYVICDGTRKTLQIQIHKPLVNDDSPAPAIINKQLTKVIDPNRNESPYHQTFQKPQKQGYPLKITPEVIAFGRTEVGRPSSSIVSLENVSTSSVRWKLSSVAPAYAKVSDTSAELLRATYPVFRFSCHTGLIRPGQTTKIDVEFRTRDAGVYCQIWDIQTNPDSPLTSTKTQMELSGEAVPGGAPKGSSVEKKEKLRMSEPVRETDLVGTPSAPGQGKKETSGSTRKETNVYFESNEVHFPDTEVGKTSVVKVKLCNRSQMECQFRVISPESPFALKSRSDISIKPGHFLKMPVYFSPEEPFKDYSGVVSLENSTSGALLQVKVRGRTS